MPLLVRVAPLFAARHDGVGWLASRVENGGIDLRPQPLRGEGDSTPLEAVFRADLAGGEHFHRPAHPGFGDGQGAPKFAQFFGSLEFSLREKEPACWLQRDFRFGKLGGQPQRERGGHPGFAHAHFLEELDDHRSERHIFSGAPGHVAISDHLVRLSLRPAPVDFEVIEHHQTAARFFQVNKRVRRKKTGGVEQVGIRLARGDDQAGQGRPM